MTILGFDFGGTKLAAGIVDAQAGRIVEKSRQEPTPLTAAAGLAAMLALGHNLLQRHKVGGVGVSFGGPVEADGRTIRRSLHIPGWEQFPLAKAIEQEFKLPALVANDANAAAWGEYCFGAGQGVRHLLYLTVSTGIGGGLIIDGKLHVGEQAMAGEVGHIVLKPDGPDCPCGRQGCLEALASGLSIARAAQQRLDQQPSSQLRSGSPAELTARDVARAAADGDSLAKAVWDEAMEWLGIGVASAANIVNPGRVVVGGGLTRAGDLLIEPVRRVAAERAYDHSLKIVTAKFGHDVGILGGAALHYKPKA